MSRDAEMVLGVADSVLEVADTLLEVADTDPSLLMVSSAIISCSTRCQKFCLNEVMQQVVHEGLLQL